MHCDHIFSGIRDIISSICGIFIIIKNKSISDQIPVTDLFKLCCFSGRIHQLHTGDRDLNTIRHVFYIKMNILTTLDGTDFP